MAQATTQTRARILTAWPTERLDQLDAPVVGLRDLIVGVNVRRNVAPVPCQISVADVELLFRVMVRLLVGQQRPTPVFNAAGDERSGARFWMSSVLNEAVVHGFDAANAAGRPADIDADIAAALISNHLAMLTSPTWEMQRSESGHAVRGTGQTLQWLATDTADDAGVWFVERRPDGVTWQPVIQQADVTVAGPARSLLLTCQQRPATVPSPPWRVASHMMSPTREFCW